MYLRYLLGIELVWFVLLCAVTAVPLQLDTLYLQLEIYFFMFVEGGAARAVSCERGKRKAGP